MYVSVAMSDQLSKHQCWELAVIASAPAERARHEAMANAPLKDKKKFDVMNSKAAHEQLRAALKGDSKNKCDSKKSDEKGDNNKFDSKKGDEKGDKNKFDSKKGEDQAQPIQPKPSWIRPKHSRTMRQGDNDNDIVIGTKGKKGKSLVHIAVSSSQSTDTESPIGECDAINKKRKNDDTQKRTPLVEDAVVARRRPRWRAGALTR
jgi:hypothetical protein